jgi:EAL domain-containing protein (putative c-di-GMP-specific phosphodiesterase class I)
MGCPIDLDDFGTGQAPLSVLRRFPVNRLKIDRSFVRAVDKDPQQREMVAAIITLADQLHLKTIAEGVETQAELTTVAQLGSQYAQGFGIARPMPLQEATAWIDQHKQKLIHLTPLGRRA